MKSKAAYGLLVGVGFLAMAATAQAADAYTASASPFNGFYMGVHAGYGWADTAVDYDGAYAISASSPDADPPGYDGGIVDGGPFQDDFSVNSKGALLGAHAGANFVSDSGMLLGMEVSGSWADISGEDTFTDGDASVTAEQTIGAIGLAQLKLGFANETAAIYALGGLALGQMETSAGLGGSECVGEEPGDCVDLDIVNINDKQTVAGWTIGAGADAMVSENVSIGVTYNYVRFDYENSYDVNEQLLSVISILGEVNTDTSVSAHLMKASVSYHF